MQGEEANRLCRLGCILHDVSWVVMHHAWDVDTRSWEHSAPTPLAALNVRSGPSRASRAMLTASRLAQPLLQYLDMNGRRLLLSILTAFMVAPAVLGQPSFELALAPAVRFAADGNQDPLGPGFGARLEGALVTPVVPVRVALGVGGYGFASPRDDIDQSIMGIPHLSLALAPRFDLGAVDLRPFLGVAYRHYFAWHVFNASSHTTYRPIIAVVGGADVAISDRFLVGPVFSWDRVLDNDVRYVLESGIRVILSM